MGQKEHNRKAGNLSLVLSVVNTQMSGIKEYFTLAVHISINADHSLHKILQKCIKISTNRTNWGQNCENHRL